MNDKIPAEFISEIRLENCGIIYLRNSDTFEFDFGEVSFNDGFFKLKFFGRNAYIGRKNKALIKWRYNLKFKDSIHLCFFISKKKTSIKDLSSLIKVFEELVRIKGFRKIITYCINENISPQALKRLGYTNVGDDLYEKTLD